MRYLCTKLIFAIQVVVIVLLYDIKSVSYLAYCLWHLLFVSCHFSIRLDCLASAGTRTLIRQVHF